MYRTSSGNYITQILKIYIHWTMSESPRFWVRYHLQLTRKKIKIINNLKFFSPTFKSLAAFIEGRTVQYNDHDELSEKYLSACCLRNFFKVF